MHNILWSEIKMGFVIHPVKERIGKKMVGGDNERALHYGESYITKQKQAL